MRQPGLTVKILLFMKILFGLCPLTCGAQRSLDYAHASPKLPTNSDTGRQTENSTTVPTDLRPLDFDVVDRELKIKRLVFSPDMKSSNGKSIKFGDILFDENTLKAELKGQQLSVNWDPRFIKSGELSIVDRDGKEKFKAPANGAGSWSMALNFDEQKRIFSDSGRFRFCLRHQQNSQYFTALCSRWYAARAVHTGFEIDPARDKTEPRMFVDQEEVRPSFQREVQPGTPLHFFANIASGDTLEFLDQPTPPQILDAVKIDDKHFQIKGLVPAPINPQPQIISGENYPGFVRSIGFEKTINGSLDHWVARVPFKKPELLLPGTHGGGYFKVELELQNLPSEQDRHFISARVTTSSYRPDDSLRIYDANKSEILWTLNSPNKFADNKSVLSIKGSHSEHQIYINSYRGAPGSASVRLTGIGGTGGEALLFLAEAQLAYWFNDIFRWDNYWLGRQRWGTSARFFTSTSRIQRLGGNLSVAQFDLRYRFQPGLCERDPATGAILAVESVTLPGFKTEKIGIGFFWSRSMPKVFDRWISLLPYMNYPKWVDMEFVRYVSSTKSDIELGEDYLLNFQGKVLWRKNFFGEAGFGAKFYSARNRAEDSRMQLSTFHGTAGLGFNF